MKKKKVYDLASIDGLKKMFNDAVKELSEEVLFQIESAYESNIDRFYNDYNPLYYNRTYSTYLASSGYSNLFSPQNINPIEGGFMVGIGIDSNNISGNPYRADTDWVFNRTYMKGIHGINATNLFSNTYEKKFRRVKGKLYAKTYQVKLVPSKKYALKRVSVGKIYTGDVKIMDRTMSNLVPSPSAGMNKWWKKFKGKRNFNKMFSEILDSKLL